MLAMIFGFQWSMMAQKSNSKTTAPKEDIKVNREYDENGNLIKFDSLYSYSWSGDTLLLDSIHPSNFPDPFGNNFNFLSDSSFFELPFIQGFDQHFFGPFSKKQDSIMNQFQMHHQFHFKNDTINWNSKDIDDLFRKYSENKNDSMSIKSPSGNQFNFSPNSMNDMIEMLEKQMKQMEEQQQKYFSK
jgi:hypothetical protein